MTGSHHASHGGHDHLRYLRRRGNRRVRNQRRRRSALRAFLVVLLWAGAAAGVAAGAVASVRWATDPGRFRLDAVEIRGLVEGREEEILALTEPWMGVNLLTIPLPEVEAAIRKHAWIGDRGSVRIQRRLPRRILVTVRERQAAGIALVDGHPVLVDDHGAPIDRLTPRYAHYDFPIIRGTGPLIHAARRGRGADLREGLRAGVEVTRVLAGKVPAFYARVATIDVSDPGMVTLLLEDADYELRLSREDTLRNLDHYFALRPRLETAEGAISYVDLRWRDRVTVWPASALIEENGGRHASQE